MLISELTHPDYDFQIVEWLKWRTTYRGGREFIDRYLRRLSRRETTEDFQDRKAVTYCTAFAKAGVNEIRDSIYQRMIDITRIGGSPSYQAAIHGLEGGVDNEGSSMNYFMGCKILPELLTMRKVGIFIDMPPLNGPSAAHNARLRPYVYLYRAEDIFNWIPDESNTDNECSAVLLQEAHYSYDTNTGFPLGFVNRYRRIWKDDIGLIWASFYDENSNLVDQFGNRIDEPMQIGIDYLPFVIVEISESLLTDVADYQIALMNLASTDMGYVLKSNYPFYTEMYDSKTTSPHLRPAGTDTTEADEAKAQEIIVGPTRGRRYPKGTDRPGFVHPSPEPIIASMQKQEQIKADIRQLLRLTLANLRGPKMASAESKQADSSTLETGLSYIGLALENAERRIATIWQAYEGKDAIATVNYPENYSLRTEADRLAESAALKELITTVPSSAYQKAIAKRIADILLGVRVSRETLDTINMEIDDAPTVTSDPATIQIDVEAGLVGLDLASRIRGYPPGEVKRAEVDHTNRLARIATAQSDAAARGNPDAAPNPTADAAAEKTASRDTTQDAVPVDKTRGDGKPKT